jgi:mono/diheme cytochrome c family protein
MVSLMNSCGDSNRDYGNELYTKHCANCHGIQGQGLQDLYPPLKGADYLIENQEDLSCLILYGIEGEIVVNGRSFNEKMSSIPHLSHVDLTNIINHISKNIEPSVNRVTLKTVKNRIYDCK